MKKRYVFSFLFTLSLLAACSQTATEDGLIEYDTEEVNEFLKYLTFHSQMPTLLPFKPEKVTVSAAHPDPNSKGKYQSTDFHFHKSTGRLSTPELTFRTSIHEDRYDNTDFDVELNDGTEARFGINNEGIKILKWGDKRNEDIYYQLFAYEESSISKEQLIHITNHFTDPN
ncbi:MAG: hypothetical protein WAM07_05630 [Halobacillus sp.]|uniref:hypothetical protein n=1 Tax=Halobacillus sp. TaxID=56800 RepID=UPI003BAF9A07